jgi:cytoskeleton protein RodZ
MNSDLFNNLQSAGDGQGIGALLREARERSGLSLQDVSQRLKMHIRVLESLENENWEQLSAPVFIRGQLRSYAKLLNVDAEPFLQQFQAQAPRQAELVSHSHTPPYQHLLEGVGRRLLYVVITVCFIAIPVWLATRPQADSKPQATAALDVAPAAKPAVVVPPPPPAVVTASLTPLPPHATAPALGLKFNADSWVQIVAPDGSTLEQGLLKSGEERSFEAGQVGRMVIGNAGGVEVQQAGSTVDTTPFRAANVARFAVSSDGSLHAVAPPRSTAPATESNPEN